MKLPAMPTPRSRTVRLPGDTSYVGDSLQLTRTEALAWYELPLVPYAFRPAADRRNLGWSTTLSLAALKAGRVHLKAVLEPAVRNWKEQRDLEARRTGSPAPGWNAYLERQDRALARRHAVVKHVYLGSSLGRRRLHLQNTPLADAEVSSWNTRAADRLKLLSKGSLAPQPVDVETMLRLRRHPFMSGLAPSPPPTTGRPVFGAGELVDELADIEITPLPRMIRVDTPSGTRWRATFVLSAFPVVMPFFPTDPNTGGIDPSKGIDPWLAWADRLPFPAEYDLVGKLIPAKGAKRDIGRRLNLARDQKRDAGRAGHDLPIETTEMMQLARDLEYEIPNRRLPLFYGWARIRVSSDDPHDLPGMYGEIQTHYGQIGGNGIDVAWPSGTAQEDLLYEAVPGARVRYKSYLQRWMLETVACALPTAASGAGDETGDYRGYTTGRYRQAVQVNPWHAIRALNKPAGIALVGDSGAGKSAALQNFSYGAAMGGITQVVIDPSGPLTRLGELKDLGDRVSVINLLEAGGGVADPLGKHLIPMPDRTGDESTDSRNRMRTWAARQRLEREVLHGLLWRQFNQHPESETEMLRAIEAVGRSKESSTAAVIDRLAKGNKSAALVGEHLRFALSDPEAGFLYGEGGDVPALRQGTSAVFTLPGVALPEPGTPMGEWSPSEQLGQIALTLAAYMGRRLLWALPNYVLKMFSTDESYILLDSTAGRRLLKSALFDGRKRGCAVLVSVPNADMLLRFPELSFSTKFLFRTEGADALTSALRLGGVEDAPDPRRQISSFSDGESLYIGPEPGRDRFQWDRDVHPDLRRITDTTPTGEAWSPAAVSART